MAVATAGSGRAVEGVADGELVAFCTLWLDPVTRTGYFEPCGTDPDHQRKGLGKAVMLEAMRRAKDMDCVTVGGYSDAANALYSSVERAVAEGLLVERG